MLFTTILKDNKYFLRCYRKGFYTVSPFMTAYFYPNGLGMNRLGITAGKKLGKAVTRVRIKRILRAGYRLCETEIPIGYDIVLVGRAGIEGKNSDAIVRFIRKRLINDINKRAKVKDNSQ